MHPDQVTTRTVSLPTCSVFLSIPENVHVPPSSSVELAKLIDVHPGEHVLDLGCGSGLFSVAAAKLGAAYILATDIAPAAVKATLVNARHNDVAERIAGRAGFWYNALTDKDCGSFDVIVANPPQTPGERAFGPRYGGPDGTDHLVTVIEHAPRYLIRPNGRLFLMVISLADTKAVLQILKEHFADIAVMKATTRVFTPQEYDGYDHGLFSYFLARREKGLSEFHELMNGRYAFRNIFIRAGSPL